MILDSVKRGFASVEFRRLQLTPRMRCVMAITETFAKKTIRPRNFRARKQQITETSVKNSRCIRNRRDFEHENGLKLRIH